MHDGFCCRRCPLSKLARTPLGGACGLHDHFPLPSTLHGLPCFLRRLCRCSLNWFFDFSPHGGFYSTLSVGCGSGMALAGLDMWTINFTGRNSSLLHTRSSSMAIQYALRHLALFHCVPDSLFPPLLQRHILRRMWRMNIGLTCPWARHFKADVTFRCRSTSKMILHSFFPAQFHTVLFGSLPCPVPPCAGVAAVIRAALVRPIC